MKEINPGNRSTETIYVSEDPKCFIKAARLILSGQPFSYEEIGFHPERVRIRRSIKSPDEYRFKGDRKIVVSIKCGTDLLAITSGVENEPSCSV